MLENKYTEQTIVTKYLSKALSFDFLVLICLLSTSPFLILKYKFSFTISTIVYFLVPSIYLLLRKPRQIKQALAGALLLGTILGTWFDIFAEFNHAWVWPKAQEFFFNFSFLNLVPIDIIFWLTVWVFYIIIFYEHFFKHEHTVGLSPRYKTSIISAIMSVVFLSILYFISPQVLYVPFTYFSLGLLTLSIGTFFLLHERKFIKSFILTGVYFFFIFVIFELTSLILGHWAFPGKYIATINFFNFQIPFEEFFFWIVLSSPILLSFYEFLVDDIK